MHGVRIKTTYAIQDLEDWCATNCKGNYQIQLDDMKEAKAGDMLVFRKEVIVLFEHNVDKEMFKNYFSTKKSEKL
jgi:hypothetical protein